MPDSLHPPNSQHKTSTVQYPLLFRYRQLNHATFTRFGGTSKPPYHSLNTSTDVGDSKENVSANLSIIKNTMGVNRILCVRQSHGNEILVAGKNTTESSAAACRADAMVTNISGTGLLIKQADCQAVILFDPFKNVVANVHCGWKGNVKNILGRVVRTMHNCFQCKAEQLVAAIGPSLGPCCAEFVTHNDIFPSDFEAFRVSENHFDLWRLSSHQLVMEGVASDHIAVSGICTRCHTDRFFSYRGEGVTGRFATVAMLK